MNRWTEIITLDFVEQMPSLERIRKLSRERTLKLVFKDAAQKQRENIGSRLREQLPGFLVSIPTIEPEINIAKLITQKEIEDNQLFFEKCAQDYRQLGETLIVQLAGELGVLIDKSSPINTFNKFKNGSAQRGSMNQWEYFLHGIHCGFQHKKTGQIIEVCLCFGEEFGDLDPYFFSNYIKSTASYLPIPVEIYEPYADGASIIDKMLELGRFEKINKNERHHPGVVVTNRKKRETANTEVQVIPSGKPKFNFWKFIKSI